MIQPKNNHEPASIIKPAKPVLVSIGKGEKEVSSESTIDYPPPLVPADCDLQDFAYMPLDVRRLRDSDMAALESPEAFMCGVLLWCASWHQVPAGSLPDDDRILAQLAGYGRVVTEWMAVRSGALRGWVKCSDGRLYHPTVSEKAREAWDAKEKHAHGKMSERMRKSNKDRERDGTPVAGIPKFDQWISDGKPSESFYFPQEKRNDKPESDDVSAVPKDFSGGKNESSGGIPAEKALKGKGEGEGELTASVTSVTGGKPPRVTDPDEIIFGYGVPLLVNAGTAEKQARTFLGGLRKNHGDTALIDKLRECIQEKPLQPLSWLAKALPPSGRSSPKTPTPENFADRDYTSGAL